jgi:hypothetical protein
MVLRDPGGVITKSVHFENFGCGAGVDITMRVGL